MIRSYRGQQPKIHGSAYIDPSAQVIGRAEIGARASVWCNVTIRGDVNSIRIGEETNIQDNSCLHVDRDAPLRLGERIVVGHSVTLHGCEIENDCLIGMSATVLSGAKIGAGSIVAAGSLVLERAEIPPRSLVMGAPAKVKRETTEGERAAVRRNAQSYVDLSREYLEELKAD
jgi:carbonic anhydrase/acetyltransferase-like protein (isoleucine patch superfamily)